MNKAKQFVASVLIMMLSLIQLPVAQASIITTDQAIHLQQGDIDRTRLLSLLEKEGLQQQLIAHGVDAKLAAERIQSMSNAEVAMLNAKLDEMPAGEGILGLAAFFFLVFIITDALGATDIFTFVKPVR